MSTSFRDRIRKRREEEDVDMMLFLFPVLSLLDSSSRGEKKQCHVFDESGEVKVRQLLQGHEKNCRVNFWMEPRIFKALVNYLRRNKIVLDSRVKVVEKLGFFLYMLSHNSSYEDLQISSHHSNGTFHHYINHFFKKVIPILAHHFLKAPDLNLVHPKIAKNPRFFPSFRNWLGAIDVIHIPISISSEKLLLLEIGRGHSTLM
jgi:hypothetical protein